MLTRNLLENLEQACEVITKGYEMQTGGTSLQFGVLQLRDKKSQEIDIVRQAAMLYDEYKGNEEYIHIPDINQMLHNLQNYPVLGVWNKENGELEGIVTIKYHDSAEKVDPYYPKEGVNFFSITGVIVKQREGILHKGLGSNLYAASILGIQKYAEQCEDKNLEMNVVIDCTNLPSLYALNNANENIKARGLLGKGKELDSILDAIYTVRDEEGHLVEAPTYVIKIPLTPKKIQEQEKENTTFSFSTKQEEPRHKQYEVLLGTILEEIKQDDMYVTTQMEDEGTGTVTYISVDNLNIRLEDMKVDRNGAQNIGKKRVPRNDVGKFVGPMPDFTNYIEDDR